MSGEMVLVRPTEVIAAEINHIKKQTQIMVINNCIEIGRRLVEAKQRVPHGEWGKWLEESVDYKQSTANNLMRIFEEYGAQQLTLFEEDNAKSQAFGNLSYSKAVALLGVPAEEREDFIQDNDVDSMSTRELQQAIKDLNQAKKDLAAANKRAEEKDAEAQQLLADKQKMEGDLAESQKKLKEIESSTKGKELKRLQQDLEEADKLLSSANDEIKELNELLKDIKENPIEVTSGDVVEKVPEEIEKELAELRKKQKSAEVAKFIALADTFSATFTLVLESLSKIEEPDEQERYKQAVTGLLTKMAERL